MNALDLIFKHYEDFLMLSEHFQAQKPMLNEMESNFRKNLNKNQLSAFDDLILSGQSVMSFRKKKRLNAVCVLAHS